MNPLIPIPSWDAAHPVIVHLPIGVLLAFPVLVLVSMLAKRSFRAFGVAALVVLLMAAVGAVLATASGDAAEDSAHARRLVSAAAAPVLHDHEEAGELARNLVLGLLVLYAALVSVAILMGERLSRFVWNLASAVVLVLFAGPMLAVVQAGHLGGKLVHVHGVVAPLGTGAGEAVTPPSSTAPTPAPAPAPAPTTEEKD
jgi:uncharacterized membrane protein